MEGMWFKVVEKNKSVTYYLILTCVLFYIPCVITTNFLTSYGSSYEYTIGQGQFYRLLTCIFCHGGLMHLLCNMFSLYTLGKVIEVIYTPKKMLTIFLTTGICASLFSVFMHHYFSQDVLSIGASGAICGLVGAYIVQLKRHNLITFEGILSWIVPIIVMSLLPGIDLYAHLGGIISGCIIGGLLK